MLFLNLNMKFFCLMIVFFIRLQNMKAHIISCETSLTFHLITTSTFPGSLSIILVRLVINVSSAIHKLSFSVIAQNKLRGFRSGVYKHKKKKYFKNLAAFVFQYIFRNCFLFYEGG